MPKSTRVAKKRATLPEKCCIPAKKLLKSRLKVSPTLTRAQLKEVQKALPWNISTRQLRRIARASYTVEARQANLARRARNPLLLPRDQDVLAGWLALFQSGGETVSSKAAIAEVKQRFGVTISKQDMSNFRKIHAFSVRSTREDKQLPSESNMLDLLRDHLKKYWVDRYGRKSASHVVFIDAMYLSYNGHRERTIAVKGRSAISHFKVNVSDEVSPYLSQRLRAPGQIFPRQ